MEQRRQVGKENKVSKRLTDTDKWERPWFRDLPAEYKVFWIYLCDRCDRAGVWYVDQKAVDFHMNQPLDLTIARGLFEKQVIEIEGGKKWYLTDFIFFQYGVAAEDVSPSTSSVHKGIWRSLRDNGLDKILTLPGEPLVTLTEALGKPPRGLYNKAKDKDKDKDKDKNKALDLLEAWNELCGNHLPKAKGLSSGRVRAAEARLKERPVNEWKHVIQTVAASDFCRGINDRGWRASFDWLIRPDTALKVLEGKYDNRAGTNGKVVGGAAPINGKYEHRTINK